MIRIQQPLSSDPATPFRPRGGFPAALARGMILRAPERLIYLGRRRRPERRPCGWFGHGFVAADGSLVRAVLPPDVRLFVWEAGRGPTPGHSVSAAGDAWGHLRARSLHALSPAELDSLHRLWKQFGQRMRTSS